MRRSARFLPILALTIALAPPALGESTIQCPPGTIDAVDWLTLDSDLRATGHMTGSHPLYTLVWPDKTWWIKESSGSTWDILRYDSSKIQFYITNLQWADPTNFSEHLTSIPLAPRCAPTGYPGWAQAHPDTTLRLWDQCNVTGTTNIGYAVTSVWGPYTAGNPGLDPRPPIGGIIPNNTVVYTFSWRWGCNANYAQCAVKEEFIVAQRYGLVRWDGFHWENGGYVLDSRSTFNQFVSGTVNPNFVCF